MWVKNYLDANKPVELDFIYGSLSNDNERTLFIPLDGQQRLTTLFLLQWYLAVKEKRLLDFRKVMLSNSVGKFSYETRISSSDFCNALISNDFDFDNLSGTSISYQLKDSSWFFLSWQNDPTILSMLVVIDHIHIIFSSSEGFYDKLVDVENPIICFQFIELKNFGLSDSLYVKMNSRGKELTEFENFKARFEQHIEKLGNEKSEVIKAEFTNKIDTDWTDLFWNYRDTTTNVFDSQLMNFIRVLATNNYSLRQISSDELEREVKVLIDKTKKVSFVYFESLKCLDIACLNDIVKTLDYLKNGSSKIKMRLYGLNSIDESDLFEKVIQNELNYKDRVLFFAYYKYLIVNNGDTIGLFSWMRIIRNLTANTIYNDANGFTRSIKSIGNLLKWSNSILQYISVTSNKIEGFAEIQIFEERIKAALILKGDEWKETILKIENHKYFLGQIDFILKFSGIKDYYKANNNLSWNNSSDETYYKLFTQYLAKASIMFVDPGLNQFENYLWQRALLSKGDYLLYKASNFSFLINEDRDISWKRLLRDDEKRRDYLKLLFDEISIQSVKKDLEQIIKNDISVDWRKYFIKYPELLDACGENKFIRFISNDNILLLETSRTNGLHSEYYSFALGVKLREQGNIVEYIGQNSVEHLKYISVLNYINVQIAYQYNPNLKKWMYRFGIYEPVYQYFDTEEEIIDYLYKIKYIK